MTGCRFAPLALLLLLPAGAGAFTQPASLGQGSYPKVGAGEQPVAVFGSPSGGLSAAFGRPFGPPARLAPPGGLDAPATLPKLAVDRRGDAVVALQGDASVRVAVRAPGGAFTPLTTVARETHVDGASALRVAIGDDGRAAVAWSAPVRLARRAPGGSFGGPERVAPRHAGQADVAVTGRRTLVVWARRGRIEARAVSARGKLGGIRVLSRGTDNHEPRIASAPEGALVTWTRAAADRARVGIADVGPALEIKSRQTLDSPDTDAPFAVRARPAAISAGGALIAFTACLELDCYTPKLGDQGGRLYVARRNHAGFGVQPLTGPGTRVLDPDVAMDEAGDILVAYTQGDPSQPAGEQAEWRRAWATRGTLRDGFRPAEQVSRTEFADYNEAIDATLDADGTAIVVWSGYEPPDFDGGEVFSVLG